MKKSYFIAPLAALALFIAVYGQFHRGQAAREAAKTAQAQAARQASLQAEQAARKQAIDEALRTQEARKKEREAREAVLRADQEIRQAALDERDRALHEFDRLTKQLARIEQDLADGQAALAKLDKDAAAASEEQAFLAGYVEKAKANAKSLAALLDKLAAADAARASAAMAATDANRNS